MIHFIIYSIIISLFSTINGMDQSQKKSLIHVKTTDNQTVLLNKAIIQQSNLLTVLQDIYKGTEQQPLMAPVTKAELDIFSTAVRQPARVFATQLNSEEYASLMVIAEKLKAQLFLADLMERILPDPDAINLLAQTCLDKAELKKAIYKKNLKKKSTTLYQDNMKTKSIGLKFCYDGSYFAETITTEYNLYTINLRKTQNFVPFGEFMGIRDVIVSPDNTFLILNNGKDYGLYDPISKSKVPLASPPNAYTFPKIHPKSDAIIIGNRLHSIDNEYKITTTYLSDNDKSTAIFHSSRPLIISAEKNNVYETEITVHDIEKSNKKLVGTYQTTSGSGCTNITINSDGSLLLIDNVILLNIQDPYNPIILQQRTAQAGYISKACFQKQTIFVQAGSQKFFLFNKDGKEILLLGCEYIRDIIEDPTNNLIALLFNNHKNSSTVEIFKTSNLEQNAQPITIKEDSNITNIAFVNDQLLLTQSYTTKLWDMEGDAILDFGKIDRYAVHPQTNSIIASRNLDLDMPESFTSSKPIQGPTKLYHYTINTPKAQQAIKTITESLTLSQALLLNKCFAEKVKKQKKLYPNLPDGRAFDSLPDKHTFLAPNLKLSKTKYLPIQTIQKELSEILPGVFREELLERGEIRERVITAEQLNSAEEIFLINSVRKWRRVTLTG